MIIGMLDHLKLKKTPNNNYRDNRTSHDEKVYFVEVDFWSSVCRHGNTI